MELMKQERPAELDDEIPYCEACGEELDENGMCPYDDTESDDEL